MTSMVVRPPPPLLTLHTTAPPGAAPRDRQAGLGGRPTDDSLAIHVLLVDDSTFVRKLFGRALARVGMTVSVAEDGLVGLALARLRPPDAVISDLEMPHMDGLGLCRALRADPATRDVPIVLITGRDQMRAALDAGCHAVLHKPCSAAQLVDAIRLLLRRPAPRVE